ncbi:hypothetical protein [Pigmentiphaga litoralis]|uniref:Cofactor-independent phosphoglycerate mutase n=1 Tax=Pigmentiphaga litoralis TaxID=516702 RepID=A0A7Y9LP97_9BURK|nr:hypothetical protein [Pigmentiphaga litoralis]NYE22669.1 hypothetical protein [Pigmentiphaga litoralis]NYE83716.1 hypothetical protein [Pigmentiphaga litoralis]
MPASPSLVLVVPGALPPGPIAPELAKQLSATPSPAPTLLKWLRTAPATVSEPPVFDPKATPSEAWWLHRAGFEPPAGPGDAPDAPMAPLGAGLAALLAPDAQGDGPLWVADLAHIQVGRDGLVLTDTNSLDITADESRALLATVQPLFDADGFTVTYLTPRRWQVGLPDGLTPYAATPSAVMGGDLNDYWPKGLPARPWRRLANDVQMSWHEHPVNEARAERGEPAVNGLWLHGGAPAWTPTWRGTPPRHLIGDAPWLQGLAERAKLAWSGSSTPASQIKTDAAILLDALELPCRAQAWGDWLAALTRLDADWFAPLDAALLDGSIQAIDLVFPDVERHVTLRLTARPKALRWLPQPKQDWTRWWLHPES